MPCTFVSSGVSLASAAVPPPSASSLQFQLARPDQDELRSSYRMPPFAWASASLLQPLMDRVRSREAPGKFKVVKIQGDGRCMFRALAQGMARHQGIHLNVTSEAQEADQLRGAVTEALCRTKARRRDFQDALLAVQVEGYTLGGYCRKLLSPTFWGGEPELLVLSKMLKVPIYVFTPIEDGSSGFAPLYKAGEQYSRAGKGWKKRKPVCLLYTNGNHYDLLV